MAAKKTHRAKGEGSIFQRADGMWCGSIEMGHDGNGKRLQKRVYAKDYRALVAKLGEVKTEVEDGLDIDRSMTVAGWLDYWLPNIHKPRIRPSTYRDYVHTTNRIKESIGHKRLADLTSVHVRAMHKTLGPTRRRTAKAHVVLTKALNDAVSEGILKRNVAKVVDQPTTITEVRDPFTVADAKAVLAYAAVHRTPAEAVRWLTAFLTGARQGEVLGLTWDRVDLKSGAMDITWQLQQLSRSHGCAAAPCGKRNVGYCPTPIWDLPSRFKYTPLHAGLALTKPKSDAGQRWVPIIPPLRDALQGLRDSDTGPNPHNLVFHRPDGRPIAPSDDHEVWTALLRDAGIVGPTETRTMHAARHTAATILRAAGADEQTRMEILGHNSVEVTRVYAHADQAKNSAAMDALGILAPKPAGDDPETP